jgi:REP element-mobilizing transposase RayT
MPRRARLDVPGAIHHVTVCGLEKRSIFADDYDRRDLLERLDVTIPECGAACLAWAFLSNHVHYAIRIGHTPLSQIMRRVNTGYAVRFNLRHDRVGYLFQNRFGSSLVADDSYLRALIPYILLNPLRAGVVRSLDELESFPWSAYGGLLGRRDAFAFEDVDSALATFGELREVARHQLRVAMREEDDSAVEGRSTGSRIAWRQQVEPDLRPLHENHDVLRMAEAICDHLRVFFGDIQNGMRHEGASRARAVICHVAVSRWKLPRGRVAKLVGTSASAVSHALARGAQIVRDNDSLREVVHQFTTVPASVREGS